MSNLQKTSQLAILTAVASALRASVPVKEIFSHFAGSNTLQRKPLWDRCEKKITNNESFIAELDSAFSDDVMVILYMAEKYGDLAEGFEAARDYVKAVLPASREQQEH